MLHFMKLHNEPFELIKSGKKIIELRLYDEKRQKIKVGDVIEFCNVSSNEKMGCIVKCLHIYPSFKELYDNFNKVELGYLEDQDAFPEDMEKYYSKDDIMKYGVVGILVTKMSNSDYLQYMYKVDQEKRLDNTYALLTDFANENMQDEEKERFINNLKK